jgi:hypothetical protein
MPRMLAPTPYAQFQAKSGAAYTADAKGQIANVALGDVVDLLNSGCLFSTFSSNLTLVHGRNADGTALIYTAKGAMLLEHVVNSPSPEELAAQMAAAKAGAETPPADDDETDDEE